MCSFWIAAVCLSIAVCDAGAPGLTAAPELTAPQQASPKPNDPQSAPGEGALQKQGAEEAQPPLLVGPMRVEAWAIGETRTRYESDPPDNPTRSKLNLRLRLTGARLGDLAGYGEVIIEEMVDDTGEVLMTLEDYEPDELTKFHPLKAGKRMTDAGHAPLNVEARIASRKATKLAKVRGYMNVVLATEVEEVMIDNPLQYLGAYLDHPRLNELGIKIKVIEPGEGAAGRHEAGGIALLFEGDARKHLRRAEFFDAWLKPLYARERQLETDDGAEYLFFGVMVGKIDADTQMLLKFYPQIEEERVSFEFTDLELP